MHDDGKERRLRITRTTFADADAYASALRDWELECLASDGAPFGVEFEEIDGGALRLIRQRNDCAMFVHGTAPPNEIAIGVPSDSSEPLVWAGDVVKDGTLPVGPPGAACEGVHAPDSTILGVCISLEDLDPDTRERATQAGLRLRCSPSNAKALGRVIAAALDVTRNDVATAESPAFFESLRADARAIVASILAEASVINLGVRSRSRWSAVRRAERVALDQLAAPLSIEDLCRAAGLGERALREAFQRLRGASPMRFVRALRLRAARAELLKAEPRTGSVTDIALRCGFWHLGRFSACYREAFGERPSATLRRQA